MLVPSLTTYLSCSTHFGGLGPTGGYVVAKSYLGWVRAKVPIRTGARVEVRVRVRARVEVRVRVRVRVEVRVRVRVEVRVRAGVRVRVRAACIHIQSKS